MLVAQGAAHVWDFAESVVPGCTPRDQGYWRDVGSLDSFYDAHMDLVAIDPVFNLYNREWPILTTQPPLPGAKFVEGGEAHESIVAPGCIIAGTVVDHSVLAPGVHSQHGGSIEASVLMDNVRIGRNVRIRRAILDKNIVVPDGVRIGLDPDQDRARGFTVSAQGITVLGKGQVVPPP